MKKQRVSRKTSRTGKTSRTSRTGKTSRTSKSRPKRKASSWAMALKKASKELNINTFTPLKKDSDLYKRTKEIHEGRRSRRSRS
jgi:hypothetical protein